ncbi:7-deoxyloganetin glucosyltransferase [Capsicum annuum]|nr:7-deoxyloganetin glucosyltransferase [Capsicum annuum]
MLKLAKILNHKGFHITFVNTEYNHRRLLKSRGPDSLKGLPSFRLETIPDGLPPCDADSTQDIPSLCESTIKTCLGPFNELLVKLNHTSSSNVPPVSCIVFGGCMSFTLAAAQDLDIPNVFFWTQVLVVYYVTCTTVTFLKKDTFHLKGLLPLIYTIKPLHFLVKHIKDKNLECMGSNLWKKDPKCLEWLDSKKPNYVVYVNFGCITIMTQNQLIEFAWGLANSQMEFLWIIRPDIVSGKQAILPSEFVEETKERGMSTSSTFSVTSSVPPVSSTLFVLPPFLDIGSPIIPNLSSIAALATPNVTNLMTIKDVLLDVHLLSISRDIWLSLHHRYMNASQAKSIELKHQLTTLWKDDNTSLDQYLRNAKQKVDSLATINAPIASQDFIDHILLGFGKEYDILVGIITHFPGQLFVEQLPFAANSISTTTPQDASTQFCNHTGRGRGRSSSSRGRGRGGRGRGFNGREQQSQFNSGNHTIRISTTGQPQLDTGGAYPVSYNSHFSDPLVVISPSYPHVSHTISFPSRTLIDSSSSSGSSDFSTDPIIQSPNATSSAKTSPDRLISHMSPAIPFTYGSIVATHPIQTCSKSGISKPKILFL